MNVVSFGGGTNSTAMIIGMYLHKIPIDLILFADTGGEQPHTYEFMGTFNEWLVKHGIPKIVSVEYHDKDGNRLTLEQECINSGRLPSIACGVMDCYDCKAKSVCAAVVQPGSVLCLMNRMRYCGTHAEEEPRRQRGDYCQYCGHRLREIGRERFCNNVNCRNRYVNV